MGVKHSAYGEAELLTQQKWERLVSLWSLWDEAMGEHWSAPGLDFCNSEGYRHKDGVAGLTIAFAAALILPRSQMCYPNQEALHTHGNT